MVWVCYVMFFPTETNGLLPPPSSHPPQPPPPVTWNSFLRRCCSTLSMRKALCSQCNALGSATGLRTGQLETSHLHKKTHKTIPESPFTQGLALRSRGLPKGYRNATLFKYSPTAVAEWWAPLWLYLTRDLYELGLDGGKLSPPCPLDTRCSEVRLQFSPY